MPICWHWSLDGLGIFHVKLLEHVFNVLYLTDEGAFLELLDLKSKKELQLSHHRHLKTFGHDPIKLFTPLLISRTNYNIIEIYLAHKNIIFNFMSEESRISFAYLKAFPLEKILKAFIPCSRSLFKPVERLMELVDMVQ